MKIKFSASLLLFLSGTLLAVALGQTPANTGTPVSREDQELIKARKANEEAQAEYYREQTNKLRQPPPVATPVTGKSFSRSVAENPASVVGVVGTILGAVIVAFVGLTTLFFNNRNAIKAQRDIQFYEAMKRLGDKDSPTLRASAAGLLALMAQDEWWELSASNKPNLKTSPRADESNNPTAKPASDEKSHTDTSKHRWPFPKIVWSKPYFTPALGQLMTALLLEDNPVVIESIKDALQQLVPHDISNITQSLHKANLNLQEELASLIAEFFVISDARSQPKPEDPQHLPELWQQLESLTGYPASTLRDLVANSKSYRTRFENYLRTVNIQNSGHRRLLLSTIHPSIRVSSDRLRANITLFCIALGSLQPEDKTNPAYPPSFSFPRLFLAGGSIASGANLSGIDFQSSNFYGIYFSGANLQNTNFMGANLSVKIEGGSLANSCLLGAQLRGAWLTRVDMSNAMFSSAKINSMTSFNGCTWWKANFSMNKPEGAVGLLEYLFEGYGQDIPDDLNAVHHSVRAFLESKRAKSEPKQDS